MESPPRWRSDASATTGPSPFRHSPITRPASGSVASVPKTNWRRTEPACCRRSHRGPKLAASRSSPPTSTTGGTAIATGARYLIGSSCPGDRQAIRPSTKNRTAARPTRSSCPGGHQPIPTARRTGPQPGQPVLRAQAATNRTPPHEEPDRSPANPFLVPRRPPTDPHRTKNRTAARPTRSSCPGGHQPIPTARRTGPQPGLPEPGRYTLVDSARCQRR